MIKRSAGSRPALLKPFGRLAQAVQTAAGNSVALGYVDQGYTGVEPAEAARAHGMVLEVVELSEARRGFVLLPRRWVMERFDGPLPQAGTRR